MATLHAHAHYKYYLDAMELFCSKSGQCPTVIIYSYSFWFVQALLLSVIKAHRPGKQPI